ncbi:MAG: Holliday junction ATP-dependent DNA helicase RuvA [candidate division WS6 bacterium 34_10]|uniref:Holliday junction branch migration complex subunit RuvA n=1 Tax=candidate division WS6 bacterium 34_10 TaxID=1641389 RepID=A0A101HGA9_9BACT|nr:MAG: Holliday junction ATP-dependent DNA helicase RuvA [candidate division WS6 bacterium 34_10]
MISYISGEILKTNTGKESYIDILTKSGIGYRVYVPTNTKMFPKKEDITLYTSFQVRDDSQTLYGFDKEVDRDLFEELIGVSGVGPKTGLAILSTYDKEELEKIILEGDSKKLSKVVGLGTKGSQKVILELRGRIDFKDEDKQSIESKRIKEFKEAMRALGFSGDTMDLYVKKAEKILDKEILEIEDLLKKVLSD